MFEWLSKFDRVLVTGPQRSGTRICTKMIAHDTGFEYIDESDLLTDSLYQLVSIMERKHHVVIQCPSLCRYVHMFNDNNLAVILMRRKLEDIAISQKRIGWVWEWLELARYDRSDGVIAEVKYQYWDQYQKERVRHPFEVEYESLTEHPLWVVKDLRQTFNARQTINVAQSLAINKTARPIPYSNIFYFEVQNQEIVIINKARNVAKLLNATGQFIWKLCDGINTHQDIILALEWEFDNVDEKLLLSDLDEFFSDLVFNEFLHLGA